MLSKDLTKKVRKTTLERKKIIDNVTRLYVSILKSDNEISPYEINILYSLLINIFRRESISWEVYIRKIIESEIDTDAVLSYLNENLTGLDKVRILLSLIVMSFSDNDFSISEITQILDLARKLDLETDGFMDMINAIEYKAQDPVSIKGFRYINLVEESIFSDHLLFGRNDSNHIQFQSKSVYPTEFLMFMIDQYIFIGTNNHVSAEVNKKAMFANELYIFPKNSILSIANQSFDYETLFSIYKNQDINDVIDFKKPDYDFKIINQHNKYSMILNSGTVYRNSKSIVKSRSVNLYYDDELQIKGYAAFSLNDVIRERSEIGIENIIPKELFITIEGDFISISRIETSKTIGYIEVIENKYYLHPPRKNWDFYLNNKKVSEITQLFINTDIISINKKNFRLNHFFDLIEIPFEIEQMNVLDLKHYHKDGQLAVDSMSFEVEKNQLIGILGQSGCGKSTFLKCIAGEIIPTYGNILYDGKNFYQNINFFSQFVGYVPQEDLLFSNLTVYENLFYRGRLRMPKLSNEYLDQKIRNILINTNLQHRMHTLVGDIKKKFLSGGERRRLNIALELLFEPTVLICDEPTSGLSFSDAEQIIDSLRKFADQGKIVVITIHQPSSPVYASFDKILLMDKSGKQVFFGSPEESWTYFDNELNAIKFNQKMLLHKKEARLPEYMYSIIEYPEYKDNGEIVYEQVAQNALIKRKFSPDYWRDKYKRKMLFDLIQYDSMTIKTNKSLIRKRKRNDLFSSSLQLISFIKRSLITKFRSKTNLFITFGEAPLLALIIAFILRLAPTNSSYSFYHNINLGIFIFISIIVFIFLGLSNSIEEILAERKNILREKLLNLRMSHYLLSKVFVLGLFSIAQVVLYFFVSSLILDIRGMFMPYFTYLFLSSVTGYSIGLLISSFLNDSKAIINILPLILIPQIIFGGAIIEYEKMNRNIKLVDANPIPEVVQVMPSRWLFEGLYTSQSKLNPYDKAIEDLDEKRKKLSDLKGNDYLYSLNDIYKDMSEKTKKYPKEKYTNQYLNLTVSLMDGKFLNQNKNVFLSSYKLSMGKRFKTIYFNLLISFIAILFLNFITLFKLKYFYKE